jgi:hypothetical protein
MWQRLRTFLAHLRTAWRLAWTTPWVPALAELVASPVYQGALYGVRKCGLDASLKGAQNEALRREAIEWAGHWYREQGLRPHPWEVRVCVELAVGQVKGYL